MRVWVRFPSRLQEIKVMIELHKNNDLTYNPTSVIFLGKEFPAPVDIIILLAWQYIGNLLREKHN